jgi:hypothetical protein
MIIIDNQGSIILIKNPIHYNRTKHIDIRHHCIRKVVVACEIEFKYYNIVDMSTHIFTKPLLVVKHTCCMQMLRLKIFDQGGVLSI